VPAFQIICLAVPVVIPGPVSPEKAEAAKLKLVPELVEITTETN